MEQLTKQQNDILRMDAFNARTLYRSGQIDMDTAKKQITPYINAYNKKVVEIAEKYNQKPKKISFASFMRGR